MQNLPTPEVYEKENKYMPWGNLVSEVVEIVVEKTPQDGMVLDLMCGPGYLLGKIQEERPDLTLVGVDWDESFISFAQDKYSGIEFITSEALTWTSSDIFDVVLCTAGIHHLPDEKQPVFLRRIAELTKESGFALTADPYIDDFSTGIERKVAAARLGYECLVEVIKHGAPDDVIGATVDIVKNDVTAVEYKTSLKRLLPEFEKVFSSIEVKKTWPQKESGYGDYYLVLTK